MEVPEGKVSKSMAETTNNSWKCPKFDEKYEYTYPKISTNSKENKLKIIENQRQVWEWQ